MDSSTRATFSSRLYKFSLTNKNWDARSFSADICHSLTKYSHIQEQTIVKETSLSRMHEA